MCVCTLVALSQSWSREWSVQWVFTSACHETTHTEHTLVHQEPFYTQDLEAWRVGAVPLHEPTSRRCDHDIYTTFCPDFILCHSISTFNACTTHLQQYLRRLSWRYTHTHLNLTINLHSFHHKRSLFWISPGVRPRRFQCKLVQYVMKKTFWYISLGLFLGFFSLFSNSRVNCSKMFICDKNFLFSKLFMFLNVLVELVSASDAFSPLSSMVKTSQRDGR